MLGETRAAKTHIVFPIPKCIREADWPSTTCRIASPVQPGQSRCQSDTLASNILGGLPKVNLISIIAGTMALISVFLPWWGVDGAAFGFSGAIIRWSLWSQPSVSDAGSSMTLTQARTVQTMGLLSVM